LKPIYGWLTFFGKQQGLKNTQTIICENSVASFVVAARGRASNALETASGSRSEMGGVREKQFVPTLTMDTLLKSFPNPDFIKIDIEGAEYMAIQSATEVINNVRPIFYIEVGHEVSHQIFEIFHQAKYTAFDKEGKPLSSNSLFDAFFNVFFVPEEKIKAYRLSN
jgi:Methyltransferase FkbM domain